METLALPVLLSVIVWLALLPTFTLPKLTLVGAAESCAMPWPDPLSATVTGEVELLFTRLTLPLAEPPVVGANVTVKLLVWPGVRVNGTVMPLMLNPVPEAVACEIVRFAEPGLLKVTVCVALLPTFTLPKATGLGDAESCGTPWPVPLRATVIGDVVPLFTRLTLPL